MLFFVTVSSIFAAVPVELTFGSAYAVYKGGILSWAIPPGGIFLLE